MSSERVEEVKIGVAIVGELVRAAGDDPTVKAAASNLGQAALTISRTINNALLPLAAVNFAFDKARIYFEDKFSADLADKTMDIPFDQLREPKASVAGPALQGLAFSHEDESLRDLFLRLIASSMDCRFADFAHPSFVEIIKQLDSVEAGYLGSILKNKSHVEMVNVKRQLPNSKGWEILFQHLALLRDKDGRVVENKMLPAMIDNWRRLGLIEVSYTAYLTAPGSYEWVEQSQVYRQIKSDHPDPDVAIIQLEKGYFCLTNLGVMFAKAVQAQSL